MKKDKFVFAVYTQERLDTGLRPFIVWEISAKVLENKWIRRYGITPVKIVPAYWNIETSRYEPEPAEAKEEAG